MLFLCIVSWGVCPKPRHKGLFVKSPLESQKLCQNKVVHFERSSLAHLSPKERCVRIFKGLFQKPLKARFGTQFQLLTTIKKTRQCRVFCVSTECWGVCPQPRHKGLFVKSPLEPQKLHQNKVVYFEGNSLAHFSFKKSRSRIYAKTEKYSFRAMPDSAEHENSHTTKTHSASPS